VLNKFLFCLILILSLENVVGQSELELRDKQRVSLNIFDQSLITLPTIKGSYDYNFFDDYDRSHHVIVELGYNFRSNLTQDNRRVSGLYSGLKYAIYNRKTLTRFSGFSFGYNNLHTNVDGYLKVQKNMPGLSTNGQYFEYEVRRFKLLRNALTLERFHQFNVIDGFYFELKYGLGLTYSRYETPSDVVQTTYRNGFFFEKEALFPTFIVGLNIGYRL
jgi:hypothetical protein